MLAERVRQPSVGQRGRPQLDQQRAHLGQRSAREIADLLQARARLGLVDLPQLWQDLRQQAHAEQRLRDRVVQLARQPAALLKHRELLPALGQQQVLPAALDRSAFAEKILDEALINEDYEKAAQIRDIINSKKLSDS